MERVAQAADVARGRFTTTSRPRITSWRRGSIRSWRAIWESAAGWPRQPGVRGGRGAVAGVVRAVVCRAPGFAAGVSAVLFPRYAVAGGGAWRDGLLALYARMIGNSQASGGIRADLPAPYLATMFHHLYLGALMRWLADPALSLDTEFSCALDVFLQGVLRVAPRRGWVEAAGSYVWHGGGYASACGVVPRVDGRRARGIAAGRRKYAGQRPAPCRAARGVERKYPGKPR